jgi:hypothetical protein
MNDAQRYRMNVADCLSAAERCGPTYRDLTASIAETWLALARRQDAMDELLTIWSKGRAATPAAPIRLPFRYPCEPSRGRITALYARKQFPPNRPTETKR